MAGREAKSRRRWLLFKRISFFFKAFCGCAVVVALIAGYLRFRVEKISVAYQISENTRMERNLIEEVAAAEARYNELFSSRNLSALAAQRGFREPKLSDFIYESEIDSGSKKHK